MNDRTLLITVLTFAVLVFGALIWFEVPFKLTASLRRLRSMKFLANFYHSDMNEVDRWSFFFSPHGKQTLILQRWLTSHLDIATLAILARNGGYPFDPISKCDYNMTLAEKNRRKIPVGYERHWVAIGVSKAKQELLDRNSSEQGSVA